MKEIHEFIDKESNKLKFDLTSNGGYKKTFRNLLYFINNLPDLDIKYNELSHEFEVNNKEMDDVEVVRIRALVNETYKVDFSKDIIIDVISYMAKHYNPVINYLENLEWDGVNRLEEWMIKYAGSPDNGYIRHVSKLILVSACARVCQPACKFDYMFILEGRQGIGKSMLVHALGDPWVNEISLVDRDKETVEKMLGCWIIEVPEIPCFRKKDLESLKAFVTTREDKVRLPYHRRSKKFMRQSIFIGTINPELSGYLQDITGNRRFLPVEVEDINVGAVKEVKDQLFAEAVHLYKHNYPLYINDKKILELATEVQDSRQIHDEWEDIIGSWIKVSSYGKQHYISTTDICREALGLTTEKINYITQKRVSNCMFNLGFKRPRPLWFNGQKKRFFDPEEIKKYVDFDGKNDENLWER